MTSSPSILAPALNLFNFNAELELFATSPEYQSSMSLVFDVNHDYTALQPIFAGGSTGVLNLIEIVPVGTLNGAFGGFSRDTNQIYLESGFINSASPSALTSVILEEYGHYIDAQLNPVETIGDEGEIFADLVQKKSINPAAFTEDDTERVNIDGNWITVEQAQGDSDPTFGGGTGVTVSPYKRSTTGEIVVQPDGKILISTTDGELGVIRFNSDGTLDTTFGGGDGLATIHNDSSRDTPSSLALQADGKILTAGSATGISSTMTRYNNDGTLDTSFGDNGIITIPNNRVRLQGRFDDIVIQSDGKIVVTDNVFGGFEDFLGRSIFLKRYNPDGSSDTSFGDQEILNIGDTDGRLAIQPDGKILATTGSLLDRFNSNGSADSSWDEDGKVSLSINDVTLDIIALQPDGKILVTGSVKYDADSDLYYPILARFNTDGTLDSSFGDSGGIIYLSSDTSIDFDVNEFYPIKGLTIQADGKFLVTAQLANGSISLTRFDSDGSIDYSFGNFGTIITPFTKASTIARVSNNLITQPNEQILVAGVNNDGFVSVGRYVGFDPAQYGASYPDLITGIGYNPEALTQHYFNVGRFEGRVSDNFDEYRYLASNPDLLTAFGANGDAATQHYITDGFREGRSLTAFDAARYLDSYADVRDTFNSNLVAASKHYLTSGLAEGRNPNLFPSDRYIASYGDLIQAFHYNLEAGSEHYLYSGRFEGRQVTFNPQSYLNRYSDLQQAFGTDLNAATEHYIEHGFAEGRTWM